MQLGVCGYARHRTELCVDRYSLAGQVQPHASFPVSGFLQTLKGNSYEAFNHTFSSTHAHGAERV